MNHRVYRICLIMIIMAAVVSGIFYYRFTQKKEIAPSEGVFVWQECPSRDTFMPCGNNKVTPSGDTFMPCGNNKVTAESEFV